MLCNLWLNILIVLCTTKIVECISHPQATGTYPGRSWVQISPVITVERGGEGNGKIPECLGHDDPPFLAKILPSREKCKSGLFAEEPVRQDDQTRLLTDVSVVWLRYDIPTTILPLQSLYTHFHTLAWTLPTEGTEEETSFQTADEEGFPSV